MRWFFAPLMALFWLTAIGGPVRGAEPEIWFLAQSRSDWRTLLSDTGPWQDVADHVSVIGTSSWWLQQGSDADILLLFNFAQQHHIKMELETAIIVRPTAAGACGQ